MERMPTYKEILKIAFPIMIGGISESISSIVDTAFMGRLGTLTMDGMGMCNVFLLIIIMIGWSFSRPVQILVSQNYGAKNFDNIGRVVLNALGLLIPISVIICILLYFYNQLFLGFIIQNKEIQSIASEICQIRALGIPILMITMILTSFYTGIGQTKILIYSQGIAAFSNIGMNYILVFGKLGLPALGYEGSAIATVLSEVLSLMVVLFHLMRNRALIDDYKLFHRMKMQWSHIREIIKLAYPMMMLHAFSLGSWVYFFSLVEKMGEKELAISMVIKQIFTAISIPGFCLASTSNTLVGQLVGSRRIGDIFPTILRVVQVSYAILISLAILVFLFRTQVVSLFTTDIIVVNHITEPLMALLLAYLFIPFANVLFNSISALGNSKVPLVIESLVLLTYLLYLYITIHVLHGGLVLAWYSEFQYWLCLLIIALLYFWKFDWKKNIIYLDTKN